MGEADDAECPEPAATLYQEASASTRRSSHVVHDWSVRSFNTHWVCARRLENRWDVAEQYPASRKEILESRRT